MYYFLGLIFVFKNMLTNKLNTMKNIFLLFISIVSFCSCSSSKKIYKEKKDTDFTWNYLVGLDSIAKKYDNNRSTGSRGGVASKEYIIKALKNDNVKVETQSFVTMEGKNGTNIFAEIPGKSPKVIMIGSHYDSVVFGPGINDNGTGVAILLNLLHQIVVNNQQPDYTLRFAFWDAEESGIEGSKYYVDQLNDNQINQIKSYLNLDMVGTIQGEILLLDGDNSSTLEFLEKIKDSELPEDELNAIIDGFTNSIPKQVSGSEQLEKDFTTYFTDNKINFKDDYILSLSTDVYPFIGKVPTTGLAFTNENEVETDEGSYVLYAPCYHQSCDNLDNVDLNSLSIAKDAINFMVYKLAFNQ